jgi:hypothetical protein
MGTHAVLGVKMADGSITACYVHYDGNTMRPRIERFLNEQTTTCLAMLITESQSFGGMRSFHCPNYQDPMQIHYTEFLDDDEIYAIDETNFYEEDHYGARIWYLVDYETEDIIKRTR